MNITDDLKVYFIHINDLDETGMDAISLVDVPAVQRNFLCFSEEKQPIKFEFDGAKHIITGVVCLAETPIYRYSEKYGEYFVVFTKDTIAKMVEKYAKKGLYNSVNLQHNDEKFVDGIYMIESYITDQERGISPKEFKDVPDGSWIASFKVENQELWDEIVNGDKLNGFSLQGMFDVSPERFDEQKKPETFDEWLEQYL